MTSKADEAAVKYDFLQKDDFTSIKVAFKSGWTERAETAMKEAESQATMEQICEGKSDFFIKLSDLRKILLEEK